MTDRRRALSYRQAMNCENAKSPASECECRCGGKAHGRGMSGGREGVDVATLPTDDPHHATRQDELDLGELTPEERAQGFTPHRRATR